MATLLNDCGCCEGITAIVPDRLTNRPGLSQVRYRVGTHGEFLASALAALVRSAVQRLAQPNDARIRMISRSRSSTAGPPWLTSSPFIRSGSRTSSGFAPRPSAIRFCAWRSSSAIG